MYDRILPWRCDGVTGAAFAVGADPSDPAEHARHASAVRAAQRLALPSR
jgi:hypothetical protein